MNAYLTRLEDVTYFIQQFVSCFIIFEANILLNKICSGCFLSLSAVLACSLLSCLPWPSDSLSGISFLVNPGFCISPYNFLYLLASLTNFSGMCSRARPLYFLGNSLLWRVENKWWEEARIVLQNFQLMKWAYVSTSRYIYNQCFKQ